MRDSLKSNEKKSVYWNWFVDKKKVKKERVKEKKEKKKRKIYKILRLYAINK